jgi:hypothetical protein
MNTNVVYHNDVQDALFFLCLPHFVFIGVLEGSKGSPKNSTVGPRYMQWIGTEKFGSHITNLHIKRPRMTVNWGMLSRKMPNLQLQTREFANKKTDYNEVCLFVQFSKPDSNGRTPIKCWTMLAFVFQSLKKIEI